MFGEKVVKTKTGGYDGGRSPQARWEVGEVVSKSKRRGRPYFFCRVLSMNITVCGHGMGVLITFMTDTELTSITYTAPPIGDV